MKNPFRDLVGDQVIYRAMWAELMPIINKYTEKLKELHEKEDNATGFNIFSIKNIVREYIYKDPFLSEVAKSLNRQKLATRKMLKKTFKECMNDVLDEEIVDEKGNVKSKRLLIADKLIDGILKDNLDPVTLRGIEVVRDSTGEKPISQIISKGIQQKVIDVNITEEKVSKVQSILEGLRGATQLDGFTKNNNIRRIDEGFGNERVIEAELSGEPERLHNSDVLPDKQD